MHAAFRKKKRVSFTKRVLNKRAFMGLCFLHGQVFSKMALEKEDVHFIHSLTDAVLKDHVLGTQGRDSRSTFRELRVHKESET